MSNLRGRIFRGADGIDLIWRNIPAYAPFRLLFRVPAFRRCVEKGVSGHNGNACDNASKPGQPANQSKETE